MRILIAEDDLTSRKILTSMIKKIGYEAVVTEDGKQAWDALQADDAPKLAILDWEMPGMTGVEVIEKYRSENTADYTYFILLTSKGKKEEIIEGISRGADDYIVKPCDFDELSVRIRAGKRIVDLQERLIEANRTLEEASLRDPLTGLYNRRMLRRSMKDRLTSDEIEDMQAGFIMADIDHFKKVNDTYGHDAGDVVLKEFSTRLKNNFRRSDVVCRIGGEEFLVIAIDADLEKATMLAERVRVDIASRAFDLPDGTGISITCSLGLYMANPDQERSLDEFIKRADEAMYKSKQNGRNRTTVLQ